MGKQESEKTPYAEISDAVIPCFQMDNFSLRGHFNIDEKVNIEAFL